MLPFEAHLLAAGWPKNDEDEDGNEVVKEGSRPARLLHMVRRAERNLMSYERTGMQLKTMLMLCLYGPVLCQRHSRSVTHWIITIAVQRTSSRHTLFLLQWFQSRCDNPTAKKPKAPGVGSPACLMLSSSFTHFCTASIAHDVPQFVVAYSSRCTNAAEVTC